MIYFRQVIRDNSSENFYFISVKLRLHRSGKNNNIKIKRRRFHAPLKLFKNYSSS